jgi:hypothetical protein
MHTSILNKWEYVDAELTPRCLKRVNSNLESLSLAGFKVRGVSCFLISRIGCQLKARICLPSISCIDDDVAHRHRIIDCRVVRSLCRTDPIATNLPQNGNETR